MRQSHSIYDNAIRLYTRETEGVWQAGFRINGEHMRESTKTTEIEKAKEIAIRRYHELEYKSNQGHVLKGKLFGELADEYKVHLLLEVKKGNIVLASANRQFIVMDTHLSPYFRDTLIEHITETKLSKYQKWRLGKADTKLATSTLNKEKTVLRKIFGFAVDEGFIKKGDVPCVTNNKQTRNRRPHFTLEEYAQLLKVSAERIRTAPNAGCKHRRKELHYFICIMANTGMRPVEANNLRWCDIKDINETVALSVKGKDKFGELVARPPAKHYLNKIRAMRVKPKEKDKVWEQNTFKKGLERLLTASGLTFDVDGKRRCPYSFRHQYATNMLVYKNTNIYTLARNMRTSVLMLERHYAHLLPLLAKQELIK